MLDTVEAGPMFRFDPGTTGKLGRREITFIRKASNGYLVEFHISAEVEKIPDIMRGTRPDIEFSGRKVVLHTELTAALLDGSLTIDEEKFVFIDHSQTFKPEFVASLNEGPAKDLIERYASVMIMRELCAKHGIIKPTRPQVEKLGAEILKQLPDKIDELCNVVERLRRYPFRSRSVPKNCATAQTILFWNENLTLYGFSRLADNRHASGNTTVRLADDVARILKEVIDKHETLEQMPKTQIHGIVKRAVDKERIRQEAELQVRKENGEDISAAERDAVKRITAPTIKTVRAWIDALSPLEKLLRSKGEDFLLKNRLVVGMGLNVERAGQMVMIDEYQTDLMTIIPFGFLVSWLGQAKVNELGITADKPLRVIMSVMIDAFTGCILGLQIGLTATPDLAKRTFMMAMTDKTKLALACDAECAWDQFLRPEKVMHDSGNAYIAGVTEMMCAMLRMDKVSAPKARAYIRGLMERVFRTVHTKLLAQFPGRTFSDTVKRGEYDSEAEAILTLDNLIQVVTIWITDIYHNCESLGRDNTSPADLWRHEMTYGMGCRPVPDLRTMTHVFGATIYRMPQATGIHIMHLKYSSPEFAAWFLNNPKRKLKVRWWEDNMSEIQVEVAPMKWMRLEVMDPRARGLSLDEVMLLLKRDHIKRNPEAEGLRDRAEDRIQELLEDRLAIRKRARRKSIDETSLIRAEERALREFFTPTTQITSEQTHGLYGVSVSDAAARKLAEENNMGTEIEPEVSEELDPVNHIDDLKAEPDEDRQSKRRGRRSDTKFKPGTME